MQILYRTNPSGVRVIKYRNLYCLLLFMVYGHTISARNTKPAYSREDSANIMQLLNKASALKQRNPDSSFICLQKALAESRQKKFTDGIAGSLYLLGLLYNLQSSFDRAIACNKEALPYCRQSDRYQYLAATLYGNIGYSYYIKGSYATALNYYDSSIKEGQKLNLPKERKQLAVTLNNIAAIHWQLKQWAQALNYLDQAEDICKNGNFSSQLMMTLANKASVYDKSGNDAQAALYYKEALKLPIQYDNPESVVNFITAKSGMAEWYIKLNKPKDALQLLNELDTIRRAAYVEHSSVTPAYLKGVAYLMLGAYDRSEVFLKRSLKLSEEMDIKDQLINIHKTLSQVYDSTLQYKAALAHYYIYSQLRDTLLGKEKTRDINEIDTKYRTAEKDRDIIQKQLLINKQQAQITRRNVWIGSISAGALLLGILLAFRHRINRQKQDNQSKQIHILQQQHEIFVQEQEINHLNAMMKGEEQERVRIARELHDGIVSQLLAVRLHLNGVLYNKKDNALQPQDFQHTIQYLEDATKELRTTAHNMMPETVLQSGLVTGLRTYSEKMSELSIARIECTQVGLEYPLDTDRALSLYRIAQELIQNALKHAKASHILIQLNYRDALLALTVEDNGKGCASGTLKETTGMGLRNIFARVRSMKGSVDFSSVEGQGTTVYLEFEKQEMLRPL